MVDGLMPVVDTGLGNSAYLLELGDRRALAVDPSLDLRGVARAAAERGLNIAYAAETHLHADFLSGARQLAADHGADILASAAGRREFPHRGLEDGDQVDLGGLTLRALATPGHTTEHLSYLILDGTREIGVFTGGSLIVGSAARTDLIAHNRTETLARAQFRSLQRLARLPGPTEVWPTHGSGSFCAAPSTARRTSTIASERATNPFLAVADEDTFVDRLVDGLGSYPRYFDRLAEVNRRGPYLIAEPPRLEPLDPDRVRRLLAEGAVVVDVRPVTDYAAGHIRGAYSIALRPQFATWLGWIVDPVVPVIVVRNDDQDPDDIVWPALNIGYRTIAGEVAGGMAGWVAAGGRVAATRVVTPDRLGEDTVDTSVVVDVRQADEQAEGHRPGALLVELGALAGRVGDVPNGATVVCSHGERAATGASVLERAGRRDLSIVVRDG